MGTKSTTIPTTSPPRPIGLIVFKFSRKEDGNEDFVNSAFNGYHANQTQDSMSDIPCFKEPLKEIKLISQRHFFE